MKLLRVAAIAFLCLVGVARADPIMGVVTTSCGTVPPGAWDYTKVGSLVPPTINELGVLCAPGGGGVGANVNLTGLNGSAPATGNPLFVAPGTGQTFPVSATSLPLPTGAATAANQEVTAAGSSASSAQGVQGVTGGVPIPISGSITASPSANVTATDCSSTISSGGTAQNAFSAQTTLHGFTIANIDSTSGSGEPLWISFTTTAAASTAGSYPLAAPTATTFASLSSFTAPPGFGLNHALSVIAATTGHKFSCTWW